MGPARAGRRDEERLLAPEVQRFLSIWWFTGIAAAALVLLSFRIAITVDALPAVAGLTVLVTLTHLTSINFRFGRSSEAVNLVEVGLVLVLLALPPVSSFGTVFLGVLIADLIRGLPGSKVAFNSASNAAGLGLAIATVHLLRGGAPAMSSRSLAAVALGAVLYGVVHFLAVTRIVSLVEQTAMWGKVRRGWHFLISTFISTALGLGAALLWSHDPRLVVVLSIPLYLAGRGYHRLARQRRQHALTRRELDRVERVLSSTADGIALLDEDGVVEIWNAAMGGMTGLEAGHVVGRRVDEVLTLRDAAGVDVSVRGVVRGFAQDPTSWSGELVLDRPGQESIEVRVTVSVSDDGEVGEPGAVVVVSDLTELRKADRAKDDFLMRITHELRTPLTPIKGYAESLRIHGDRVKPELMEQALESISSRADHLTALIDDLLLVAAATHPGHQRQVLRRPVDVLERVRTVAATAAEDTGRSITVEADVDAATGFGDVLRLDRILAVLVDNAITYSPADTEVQVAVRDAGAAIEVSVTDLGAGIPGDHLDAIFQRFHRVEDPLLMETGGLGIGLYLARRFAASMDGTIDVTSELGSGSTFTLRLPAFRTADRAAQTVALG